MRLQVRRPRCRCPLVLSLSVVAFVILLIHHVGPVPGYHQRQSPPSTSSTTSVTFHFPNSTLYAVTSSPPISRHVIGVLRMSAGRLGNEMFCYASVLGIADRNRMLPVFRGDRLRSTFDNIRSALTSPNEFDPTTRTLTEYSAFKYDAQFQNLAAVGSGDIVAVGFFQSWKYFQHISERIRDEFRFRSEHRRVAAEFMRDIADKNGLLNDTVYVAVHIRRTDMVTDRKYTIADKDYLRRAVSLMTSRFPAPRRLVYVVCSDDINWSRLHFGAVVDDVIARNRPTSQIRFTPTPIPVVMATRVASSSNSSRNDDIIVKGNNSTIVSDGANKSAVGEVRNTLSYISKTGSEFRIGRTAVSDNGTEAPAAAERRRVVVVYSEGHTTEQDLAILASCNHTIMTVGTYGWWAAYLAGGTTVYFRKFIVDGSVLWPMFSHEDFYPPGWIGL